MSAHLSQQLKRIVFALCEDLGTVRSHEVSRLVKEDRYDELVRLRVDPALYTDAHLYWKDAVVTDLLRKIQIDIPGIDRAATATATFYAAEKQCGESNVRLSRYLSAGPFTGIAELRVLEFLQDVKKDIANVLGRLPSRPSGRFGKGATFSDRGRLTTLPDKICSRPTITEGACCLKPLWHETSWSRALVSDRPWNSEPEIVRGNRFTTVPKDALTDRGICVEPSVNLFYQLALGREIRSRLKQAGLDLKSAQFKHRELAKLASVLGHLATIDLSSASDTVCRVLVQLLLPGEWYEALDALRSPLTHVGGGWRHLQKFSSMGNGYTFELETLIFWALGRGVARSMGVDVSDVHVYGDDIIVPSGIAEAVVSVLTFAGFTPNPKKTFLSGRFRESCGGDYFDGVAVRPYYLKEEPNEPQQWIGLANGLWKLGHSDLGYRSRFTSVSRARHRALDALPVDIRRIRGPSSLGDLVINDYPPYKRRWRDQIGYIRVYRPVGRRLKWNHWSGGVVLASALYGARQEGVSPRGEIDGYKVGWLSFS